MAAQPLRVLVLAGGRSAEHPISLRSAATVVEALESAGLLTTVVLIDRSGRWLVGDARPLLKRSRHALVEVDPDCGRQVVLVNDGAGARLLAVDGRPLDAADACFDVGFPVLHGPGGEDGTVQACLELAAVPFVGAGTTASAIAMDKLALKLLCAGAGIPQTDFLAADDADAEELIARVEATFGFPCFVKPANLGSSVGISRVADAAELASALAEARRWDRRVLIERAVDAREIELAMLGNEVPDVSPPGEIVSRRGFYDYESKYVDPDDATLIAPANLDAQALATMRSIAIDVWKRIGCRGMARADFFLERNTGRVLFNELNTIPGMTSISMFPKLWALAGLDPPALMRRLVDLALEAHGSAALPDARPRRA